VRLKRERALKRAAVTAHDAHKGPECANQLDEDAESGDETALEAARCADADQLTHE